MNAPDDGPDAAAAAVRPCEGSRRPSRIQTVSSSLSTRYDSILPRDEGRRCEAARKLARIPVQPSAAVVPASSLPFPSPQSPNQPPRPNSYLFGDDKARSAMPRCRGGRRGRDERMSALEDKVPRRDNSPSSSELERRTDPMAHEAQMARARPMYLSSTMTEEAGGRGGGLKSGSAARGGAGEMAVWARHFARLRTRQGACSTQMFSFKQSRRSILQRSFARSKKQEACLIQQVRFDGGTVF